jgi:hypothetical protein
MHRRQNRIPENRGIFGRPESRMREKEKALPGEARRECPSGKMLCLPGRDGRKTIAEDCEAGLSTWGF